MRFTQLSLVVLCAAAVAAGACKKAEPKPTVQDVQPALQQEAQKLKADGEKVPDVGVKSTWTIAGVDVVPQAGNEAQPFAGTIRIKIESETHALEGPQTQTLEKKFNYVYDTAQKKWLFKM
jgi:hypothetical protein